jgi:hypothetical protein
MDMTTINPGRLQVGGDSPNPVLEETPNHDVTDMAANAGIRQDPVRLFPNFARVTTAQCCLGITHPRTGLGRVRRLRP